MLDPTVKTRVRPIPAVSAAVIRGDHILMVRRRNPPSAGLLALPGGKIEAGETLLQAAARELMEETGVLAAPRGIVTAIDLFDHDAFGLLAGHFVIVVVQLEWQGGVEAAADDATELRWMDLAALEQDDAGVCESASRVARWLLAEAMSAENALKSV